ncbi:MAG: addiction module protein [Verrucomicrobiota bacterium]
MSATEVVEQFCKLPFEEQHKAFEKIREVVHDFDEELTPEQIAEFERRGEQLRRNPASGIPWEQVRAELKERIRNRSCPAK